MEKITFGNGLPGYIIGDASAPALVVIQEWWGINDIIKAVATKISAETGFRCLVPDLYKGKIGVDAEEASHLMNALDFKGAVEELRGAVDYLRSTGAKKVGVVGFCMGGALTFAAAQHAGVDAAAPFYGTPNPAICEVEQIAVPVEAHFGKLDKVAGFSDEATITDVVSRMKAAGRDVTLHLYDDAGHSFFNAFIPEGPAQLTKFGYPVPSEATIKLAHDRTVAFFRKHLQ